jgi:sugar phosphate isomerase/epimerase
MSNRWLPAVVFSFVALLSVAGAARQNSQVQVGWCTPLRNLEAAKAAGFDYVEPAVTQIAALSDQEFEQAVAHVKEVGIPTPAANGFLPGTLKVTGPDIDPDAQMAYVRKAFERLSRMGVQIVVFGSGGARRVPDGFSHDDAFKQLVDFGKRIAPEAQAHGITVAVEPLRKEECNIINSAGEGLQLVNAIGHPNFQLMIDFYHLSSEHEDPGIVLRANTHIRHLHMANPQGRVFPLEWTEYDYAPFFANLRKIHYDKRISVEASTKDVAADGPQAIALLRRAFEQ